MPRSRSRSFEIHGAFGHALVVAERARLFQQDVDERSLAVIDVSNDRYIAQVHASRASSPGFMLRCKISA